MEAKELRIGNYVYRQSSKLIVDKSSVYQIENVNLQSALKYDPIPLTEEWLLSFGFKYWKDGIYQFWSKGVGIFQVMDSSDNNGFGIRIWINGTFGRTIYFLHDFQNLFYSLHGQELTLKN